MRSFVVLGLLLATSAHAAPCSQPSAPDIPVDTPLAPRAQKQLVREVADFIEDSARYISCLHTDDTVDRSTIGERESIAIRGVADIVDLYESRVGHSDELADAIVRIAGPMSRTTRNQRIAQAEQKATEAERYASVAIQTVNAAIAHFNAGRLAEARTTIGALDLDNLTAFERSWAERVLYSISYAEEKFEEAREHIQKALDAGGLSGGQAFTARVALADVEVMLRLSDTAFEAVAEQPVE